jgi:mono/diheme cytochrome c family protein
MSLRFNVALGAQLVLSAAMLATASVAHADDAKLLELGKKVFTEQAMPACAICHTLQDAGATGAVGPSLDELKPSVERVSTAVKGGIGIMPAFPALSDEQVKAVAHYVAKTAGK